MLRSMILLLSLVLSLPSWGDSAHEVLIGFAKDRAPYVISQGDKGISVDLFRAAFASQNYRVVPQYFSTNNLEKAIASRVDGIEKSVRTNTHSYFFSDDYLTFHNCIITKQSSGIELDELEDLTGHRIVAWPQAHKFMGDEYAALFSPEVVKEHTPDYIEHESQLAQNQMFWRDRADVMIIDENIFLWYRQALNIMEDTTPAVHFHHIFKKQNSNRAAFRKREHRDAFDAGIKALKESGEYQAIIDRYIDPIQTNAKPPASTGQTALKTPPTNEEAFDKSARMPTETTGK